MGVIEAWGCVEPHESGVRAEYARPVALLVPSRVKRTRLLQTVASAYDAELIRVRDAADVLEICERRGWGLAAATVRQLIPKEASAPTPSPRLPTSATPPSPASPVRASPRGIRRVWEGIAGARRG